MSAYDEYEGCQMKVGNPCCNKYKTGDIVPIEDGIYITYEGLVVVKDHKLILATDKIFDKWGRGVYPSIVTHFVRYTKLATRRN